MTVLHGPGAVVENRVQDSRWLGAGNPIAMAYKPKDPGAAQKADQNRYLVVSPYTEQEHLLDLDSLDAENRLLALALTNMNCLRDDYATAPYIESFNWDEIIATLRTLARETGHAWKETSFFVVAFRSQIPPTTVYAELGALDKAAHAEATASGGFLKYAPVSSPQVQDCTEHFSFLTLVCYRYWFGTPDADGRNLATCIWRSQEDARRGGTGPAHRKAAGAARALYSHWKIDRHRLSIRDGVSSWAITDWTE